MIGDFNDVFITTAYDSCSGTHHLIGPMRVVLNIPRWMQGWVWLAVIFCLWASGPMPARAGLWPQHNEPEEEEADIPWMVQGDETIIDQYHGSFPSIRPNGPNSFLSTPENSYSSILGLQLGYDLGDGGEIWLRSETLRGIPLSNAGGFGALTNNDMQRYMLNRFQTYLALAFYTRTVDLGGVSTALPLDSHQFDRAVTSHRLTWTIGKVDVLSYFDHNQYAGKNDSQFLNWCFMTSCAYDYAADARGYTWGMASEVTWDNWSSRFGWFAMPVLPNQLAIDPAIGQHFGVNGELERRWDTGSLKLLLYQGRMPLASYAAVGNQTGVSIVNQPRQDAKRGGGGLNLQQALAPGVGLFGRAFWTGGSHESMAFTEVDRSFSTGLSLEGVNWGRQADGAGIGWALNEISGPRIAYLTAGNLDLFIGDGYLLYAPEYVVETYYRWGIVDGLQLTADWQHIGNPAYNQGRGPIDVYGLRLHVDF